MKYILVIGDGMADNAVDLLGDKTPLEYTKIPNIDALAEKGTVGWVKNCPEGLPAGSDTAILSIMGYDPNVYFTGRAPLEAAASDILLQEGNIAYRCNLVSLEDKDAPMSQKKILSHCAGSIEGEDALKVLDILLSNPKFTEEAKKQGVTIHPAPSFRHMTVQEKGSVEGAVYTPPHDHLGEVCGEYLPKGNETAENLLRLMEIAHEILNEHPFNMERREKILAPANGIWFWAEGTAVTLSPFREKFGKTGAMISAVPLCHGIAKLVGLKAPIVPGATGELETNYEGKVFMAMNLLEDHDFVAIHIEAPDECTHAGDLEGKIEAIRRIDQQVIAPIVQKMDGKDFRLLLISDHKTLIATRGHDADYVPYLIYDSRVDSKKGLPYSETAGEKGPRFEDGAATCMPLLFQERE
ncbi:MAG: alkaline phosphatase family protein [Eubacteriales bacterium]